MSFICVFPWYLEIESLYFVSLRFECDVIVSIRNYDAFVVSVMYIVPVQLNASKLGYYTIPIVTSCPNFRWNISNIRTTSRPSRPFIHSFAGCIITLVSLRFVTLYATATWIPFKIALLWLIQQWSPIVFFCHLRCRAVQRDKSQTHYWHSNHSSLKVTY